MHVGVMLVGVMYIYFIALRWDWWIDLIIRIGKRGDGIATFSYVIFSERGAPRCMIIRTRRPG